MTFVQPVTPKVLHSGYRTGWAFTSVLSMLFQLYCWLWILYLHSNSICNIMIFSFAAGAKQARWLFHLLLSSCQSLSLDH